MSDSAPAKMSLLQQVRLSFGQGNSVLSQASPPIKPATVSTQEQLAILDRVLQQVEQHVAIAVTAPVSSPVTESPPGSSVPPVSPPVQTLPLQSMSAAVPLAVAQASDTLNPSVAMPVSTAKEAVERSAQPDMAKVDAGTGVQVVEYETTPEIPVEVESFLQRVEDNQDQLPQEIVIAGNAAQLINQPPALKPVIVLPITPEIEAVGAKKNPQFSVRWLVEWSRRLMKMFSGKILYSE